MVYDYYCYYYNNNIQLVTTINSVKTLISNNLWTHVTRMKHVFTGVSINKFHVMFIRL